MVMDFMQNQQLLMKEAQNTAGAITLPKQSYKKAFAKRVAVDQVESGRKVTAAKI